MLRKTLSIVGASVAMFIAADAQARITEIRIDSVELFADGHAFGDAGAYEKIKGVAKGELDPKSPQNAVIVDLDRAPVNAHGMVEYETDIFIMRPVDRAKGSGIMLYEVNNRGWKLLWSFIQDATRTTLEGASDPQTLADVGNGFAFERGYTLVWSGWDPDAPSAYGALAARVPVASDNGKPIVRRVREEFDVGTHAPIAGEMQLSYPAAVKDKSQARLAMRSRQADARTEIPASHWEFIDDQTIRLLPAGSRFTPLSIYEFWYPATAPKIVGIGFAATRDLVSFLRNERADRNGSPNPLASEPGSRRIEYALAVGISQSARFLRHYLELGMNKDEGGRPVFDGVLAHVGGIGKLFANHTFAEPGRTSTQHEDHDYPENWFPFSSATTSDPFSGKSSALVEGHLTDPVLIETNTSTEYWQKGASLLHIDPTGSRDLRLPPRTRAYLIAGTQHGGRAGLTPSRGPCANLSNPNSASPVLRALLVALEEWVTDGVDPPTNRVPSLAAGTAIDASGLQLPEVDGFALAHNANRIRPPVDWIDPPAGPSQDQSAVRFYPTHVAAVDTDGNEVAGIRLPSIAVPIGTHTGWNVYRSEPGELCGLGGSFIPFAKTKLEREATGDPRPSLEERYGSRAIYVARTRAAADALVRERLLLPADAEAYVQAAANSDRF